MQNVSGEVTITLVNLGQRAAWLGTGEKVLITNMLDEDGDETDDLEEVVVFVGHLPNGQWVTVDMRDFEDAAVH